MGSGERARGWREVATATWGPPNDAQIDGDLELDATEALRFIEEARSAYGEHVTMTHVVGKAVAYARGRHPQLNVEPRPLLTLTATMDHRHIDGLHASRLAGRVREYLADSRRYEPAL